MRFQTGSSPHTAPGTSVGKVMRQVIYALIPGAAACIWFFGWGLAVNLVIACTTALAAEAAMLLVRERPLRPYLADGSALVTAVLLALALPPLLPWWVTMIGTLFAIVVAKQLYGGLGYNPFNPAMVGYVVLLIAFPRHMTQWLAPQALLPQPLGIGEVLGYVFGGQLPAGLTLDALTTATPLDSVKTGLGLDRTVSEIRTAPQFGAVGGIGWEWIAGCFALGGLWLLYRRVITWHIPVAMLAALAGIASVFFLIDADTHASPLFHLASGGAILGAFFIATDPVTACSTVRGRLIYGAGIGLLTYIIRNFGGYPDAVAFSVLLMNMAAPTIDHYTQPRVFGTHRD